VSIVIRGASEHNLQDVDVTLGAGLTVVTGVSGSGKTSLVFDTLYHEARRRFLAIYRLGAGEAQGAPANVRSIDGLGPAVAVGQNLLNRNPGSTLATASGLHPHFGCSIPTLACAIAPPVASRWPCWMRTGWWSNWCCWRPTPSWRSARRSCTR
jgi:hypothetical protein